MKSARAFTAAANIQNASWGQVEFVLTETFIKNDIRLPAAFHKTFIQATHNRVFFQTR
jgi:hypothetical protein